MIAIGAISVGITFLKYAECGIGTDATISTVGKCKPTNRLLCNNR